ncbi:right-handed parallel beta-helix repeat-containing protein [Burkholderia gladioli]|uniref:right-handed parallel beta-helix repeat-containing protein n=1 Tax=Burkholderia gladioli TaxID=28095 RepID=UPI001640156A|nr:right-handed parallel beta-helix repeat-containing protein [Burkholderia gladioli]
MPSKQFARGIFAGFGTIENPFQVANGMEENLRVIDDHLWRYTMTAPVEPDESYPSDAMDGDGQIYIDGTYAIFNDGAWKRYPASKGVTVVQLDGPLWVNVGDGWRVAESSPVVNSVAQLRLLPARFYQHAQTAGYYQPDGLGAGTYHLDSGDHTSEENGFTVIVGLDGGRWKLEISGPVSIRKAGAKIDGVTNDTVAVRNAITYCKDVYHPGGRCLIDPIALSGLVSNRIAGVSRRVSLFILASPGTALRFSNCSDCQLVDLGFQPNGAVPNSDGVQFDTGSNINTIDRCEFSNFTLTGCTFLGTDALPLSGNTLSNSLLLSGGMNSLLSVYSSDFFYHNNQFGITEGGATPQVGAYLLNSSAGTYTENYHWDNLVGFRLVNSNYVRVINNRFEESEQQGAFLSNCVRTIFVGNTLHTNSQQTVGGYDNAYFRDCDTLQLVSNNSFSWNDDIKQRYGYFFDTGCNAVELKANSAPNGWARASHGFDASLSTRRVQADTVVTLSSGTSVAAGTTIFFGESSASFDVDAVQVIAGRQSQLYRISVFSNKAPGDGQFYEYTLVFAGIPTPTKLVISGSSSFSNAIIQNDMTLTDENVFCMKLVTSDGATAAYHRASISLVDY